MQSVLHRIVLVLAIGLLAAPILAQTQPAKLMPGFGEVQHKVSTSNDEAQKFFNQGLALCYGFNHGEAERAFRKAAELDPKLAMAWWGVAYAVGPNYNMPIDEERMKRAVDAVQRAQSLKDGAGEQERDYIDAVATRYTDTKNPDYQKLQQDYADAMKALSQKYPDDLDAATIYAESLMNLNPWKLWDKEGRSAPGTDKILQVLESVLRRDPKHIGANHLYIHAVEASNSPDKASPSAARLAGLAPASGHLVHMPAHIYIRTGEHEKSEATNRAAAQADEEFIRATGAEGIYPMMYYSHNVHFIAVENSFLGRYAEALAAARKLQKHAEPHLKHMTMADQFYPIAWLVMARFQRWSAILKEPAPVDKPAYSMTVWHFARGMAQAASKRQLEARQELAAIQQLAPALEKLATEASIPNLERNGRMMQHLLEARIAAATGDLGTATTFLRQAVAVEDTHDYTEPPDWFAPARETLGGVLLQQGKAAEAEQVFREDLKRNPKNPRSFFGLARALEAQGKMEEAKQPQQAFESAWENADTTLKVEGL